MSAVQGDLLGGSYSLEEIDKIYNMNQREKGTRREPSTTKNYSEDSKTKM